MDNLPTPHGEKLSALLENDKLPQDDVVRVEGAVHRYKDWLKTTECFERFILRALTGAKSK